MDEILNALSVAGELLKKRIVNASVPHNMENEEREGLTKALDYIVLASIIVQVYHEQ